MSSKVNHIAIPYEEPKHELSTNDASVSSPHKCFLHERKNAIRRVILFILILFLGGRFLFADLFYFLFSGCNHELDGTNLDDQYGLINPFIPKVPNKPSSCEPLYKWNGPRELLVDPTDFPGLIFNVRGMSAYGSITIRQDPKESDFINITNKIYLSEESLQKNVDIKIDVIDGDYCITIETPSFDGPRPTSKCVIIDTIITLPSHLNSFRSLIADAPNIWVSTEGLGSVDFAYVRLMTKNGHIKAEDLNAAIAEISSVNGHISGSFVVSESLDVRTVNSAINISVISNASDDNISLITKSVNGHLDISVCNLTDAQTISLRAGSVNGGVIASLPDMYTGDFYVTTLIGYAYVEGHNITYTKNLRNLKAGYKNKKDEDVNYTHHKNHHSDGSHVTLEAVTGTVELYFV